MEYILLFDLKKIRSIVRQWDPEERIANNRFLHKHVNDIMEAVFLAALKRNEDRPVMVGVSIIDMRSLSDTEHCEEHTILKFGQKQLLSVDSLVKLSPAFDSDTTILAAWPSDQDSSILELWGAIFTSRQGSNRFDILPMELALSNTLTIISQKTGVLSVYKRNELITRFSSGIFIDSSRAHYMSNLIGHRFLDLVKQHKEFDLYGLDYWNIYRDFVDYLLTETRRIGHGGTIVFMEPHPSDTESKHIIPQYSLTNSAEGAKLIRELCKYELAVNCNSSKETILFDGIEVVDKNIVKCKRKLIEYAGILARMTCVDGALILSDRLCPVSFGTFLMAPTWEGRIGYWKDVKEQSIPRADFFSKYGTRHNAAINFVGHYQKSIVFVISQDGPIAGLTKKNKTIIHWWPNCVSKWLF